MLTTGLKTPRIKSDQRDELPEMARRPERKNEKIKKVAREKAVADAARAEKAQNARAEKAVADACKT